MYLTGLKPQTWKALWIAFRRARRDPKARANLVRLLLSLVCFFVFVPLYLLQLRGFFKDFGRGGYIFLGVYAVWLAFLLFWPVVSDKLERRAQERATPSVSPEMKQILFRETCLLATLLERLGSETALEKEIPPEIQIITRRVLLDRLSDLGLREGLEPWLLDLLLAPDGHWTAEQKQRAIPAWECFSVLRWVQGLGDLPGLTEEPKYNFAQAGSLFTIQQPEKLTVLPSWDLRPARNAADNFLGRCWTELLARRQLATADEADIERALEVRTAIQEAGYTGDYLIGVRTISELDTQLLIIATRRSYHRRETLSLLVEIMGGYTSPDRLRRFFAHYFAPYEVAKALTADEPA